MAGRPASHQGRAYTREEIERRMRSALSALMADGTPVTDVSVERLLGSAGVARSTFYRNFDDKADLIRTLEAGSLKRLYASQRAWIDRGPDASRAEIRSSMRDLLDAYRRDEVVMRAVAQAAVFDPTVREVYVSGVLGYARAVQRLIEVSQGRGRLMHLRAQDTSRALAWMTERTVQLGAPGATDGELDSIADALADIVWAALFAPA